MYDSLTVAELRELAKEKGVQGRWSMNKSELIEAVTNINNCGNNSNEHECSDSLKESTKCYISELEEGSIVAFKVINRNGAVALSGRVATVLANGKFVVITKMGTKFTITKHDILWVKTNDRWPKWVFSMFNTSKHKEVS